MTVCMRQWSWCSAPPHACARELILDTYEHFAVATAQVGGYERHIVWLIEPDWHQYHEGKQQGGGLTVEYMIKLLQDMVERVRRHLPNAEISLDVSPWVNDQRGWLLPFVRAVPEISFLHVAGGRTTGGMDRIRAADPTKWRDVTKLTGLGMIADTGYGVGGAATGHDSAWDEGRNLRARVADGVVALTQANPSAAWRERLPSLRKESQTRDAATVKVCFPVDGAALAPPASLSVETLKESLERQLKGPLGIAVGAVALFLLLCCCCCVPRQKKRRRATPLPRCTPAETARVEEIAAQRAASGQKLPKMRPETGPCRPPRSKPPKSAPAGREAGARRGRPCRGHASAEDDEDESVSLTGQ